MIDLHIYTLYQQSSIVMYSPKCRRQGRQLLPEVRGTERRNGPVSMGLMTIDQAITDLGHGVSTPLKMFRKRW